MTDDERWRHPAAYLQTAQLDLVDMAWDYLRRNPAYRADATRPPSARKAAARAPDEDDADGEPEPGAPWGLHFRPIARHPGRRCAGVLATGSPG